MTPWRDMRQAARALARNPGFTSIAVLSLALGIGANSAIFSAVNALLLRAAPYPNIDRLVWFGEITPDVPVPFGVLSPPDFLDWSEQATVYERIACFEWSRAANLNGGEEPLRLRGSSVSDDFFEILGGRTSLGRTFTAEENAPGAAPTIVLSHRVWQSHFGADPDLVGKTVELDGQSATIVGVMAPDFKPFEAELDFWRPLADELRSDMSRDYRSLAGFGLLKEGVGIEQARAEAEVISTRLRKQYKSEDDGWRSSVVPLNLHFTRTIRTQLLVAFGAVGFVLLIACANVANLLLARALGREKELSIRAALGAGRKRLVWGAVAESLLVSIAGGALGLAFAVYGVQALAAAKPGPFGGANAIQLDRTVVAFTALAALLSGLLAGVIPGLHSSRPNLARALNESSRSSSASRGTQRVRQAFVVVQTGLAVVLLVGAGLLVGSFLRLRTLDIGFNPENLLTMNVTGLRAAYLEPAGTLPSGTNLVRVSDRFKSVTERLVDSIDSLPGSSAGVTEFLPIQNRYYVPFRLPDDSRTQRSWTRVVSPGFFSAMDLTLIKGRFLEPTDTASSPPVVVINRRFQQVHFGDQDPLGRILVVDQYENIENRQFEIVGVVSDIRQKLLEEAQPEIYSSLLQLPEVFPAPWEAMRLSMNIVVRSTAEPNATLAAVERALAKIDPALPLSRVRTYEDILGLQTRDQRFYAALLAALSALALLLAVVGIYGVISYTVNQRLHEIGIRMAIGADRRDVLALVLGDGLKLTLWGVAIGLAASFWLTGLLKSQLYGVEATDPLTFAAVAVLLIAAALAACWVPTRRASRVDPAITLRSE